MKKLYSIFLCLLLLCVPAQFVSSQNIADGLTAGMETLFSNGIVLLYNIAYSNLLVYYNSAENANWTTPNADAIYRNFNEPWIWEDTDGFKVNQIGHPIQGSIYFNSGRVNGFGFYESVFFNLLGSFTWESLCESNYASINDFIFTVAGSAPMGEMLFRLYLEACAAGVPAPLAAIFNPMAGFHRLVTGWKPPNNGRNLYRLQYWLGMGFAQTRYSLSSDEDFFSFNGLFGNLGFNAVYGNPFEQESKTPFEQFELAMSFGLDASRYIDIRMISDGYLFSFSPVSTDSDMMSTGLSLHMDFVSLGKFDMYDSTVDQSDNALNWTIKYQHLFSENTTFQMKLHAGFIFIGASEYYSPQMERELKNYGGGLNGKLFLAFENKKFGKLETSLFCYAMWSFPGTSAISQGSVFWLFADVTYSRFISKHVSLGIWDSFALERGTFSNFPNTRKYNNAVNLFVAWNF